MVPIDPVLPSSRRIARMVIRSPRSASRLAAANTSSCETFLFIGMRQSLMQTASGILINVRCKEIAGFSAI